jgi:hypothetical protein
VQHRGQAALRPPLAAALGPHADERLATPLRCSVLRLYAKRYASRESLVEVIPVEHLMPGRNERLDLERFGERILKLGRAVLHNRDSQLRPLLERPANIRHHAP